MLDELVAAEVQRLPDFLAFGVYRGGDAPGGFADAVGEADRGRLHVAGDAVMRDRNGAAHAIGVGENGFAFAGQFVDQRAHAPLIVGERALQIGDFRPHQRFEFAGPRQRAFDAVAHRGDLAPDRLRQRHHLLGGDGLGFGEAHRDFGHGAGGHPHFLSAPDHHRSDEEEYHGAGDGEEVKRGGRQNESRSSRREAAPDWRRDSRPSAPSRGPSIAPRRWSACGSSGPGRRAGFRRRNAGRRLRAARRGRMGRPAPAHPKPKRSDAAARTGALPPSRGAAAPRRACACNRPGARRGRLQRRFCLDPWRPRRRHPRRRTDRPDPARKFSASSMA